MAISPFVIPSYSNFLERRVQFTSNNLLTDNQKAIDQTFLAFAATATDPKLAVSLALGSIAYQVGQLYAFRTMGVLSRIPHLSSIVARGAGLTLETATLRGSQALLNHQNLAQAFEEKAFAATALDLGLLKGSLVLMKGHNAIFVHSIQSISMVAGSELGSSLHLVEAEKGSWTEKLAKAEAFNLSLQGSQALAHLASAGALSVRVASFKALTQSYEAPVKYSAASESRGFLLFAANTGKGRRITRPPGSEQVDPDIFTVGTQGGKDIVAEIYRYSDGRVEVRAAQNNPHNSSVTLRISNGTIVNEHRNLSPGESFVLSTPFPIHLRRPGGYFLIERDIAADRNFETTRSGNGVNINSTLTCFMSRDGYNNLYLELRNLGSDRNASIQLRDEAGQHTELFAGQPFLLIKGKNYSLRIEEGPNRGWRKVQDLFR